MFNSSRALRAGLCRLLGVIAIVAASGIQAGVTTERTRVIFPAGSNEVSVRVVNVNPYPVMVQTWVDDGSLESTPDKSISSLMSLPPVFPLRPSEQQTLRLLYTGDRLPADRESLFWLNIYEIPPSSKQAQQGQEQQRLMVAMRTQIKLFYRPSALAGEVAGAASKLTFTLLEKDRTVHLQVANPTPYYVTLSGLDIRQGQQRQAIGGDMVAPFGSLDIAAQGLAVGQNGDVHFSWIDDDGNAQDAHAVLRSSP